MRLLICAGGTGGGVYPALAVLEELNAEYSDTQALWVGTDGGMEAELVTKAGLAFESIPAAGVHGVGVKRLPGNSWQVLRGISAARKVIRRFQPDVMFFTGGYVAVPVAAAGTRIPTALFVPDIEPGLALKTLSWFADKITVTAADSRKYFRAKDKVVVTGYPLRKSLSAWEKADAYEVFNFSADLPTLLVTGGSLGALSLNRALVPALPELLREMQIIHLTGKFSWPEFENAKNDLPKNLVDRYQIFPYLHDEMGAAFTIADLTISRAGASSIGEYPRFGIPAILVPYPHAWRYQKVNADYLAEKGSAVIVRDSELREKIVPLVFDLIRNSSRREVMKSKMKSLNKPGAASSIAHLLSDLAASHPEKEIIR